MTDDPPTSAGDRFDPWVGDPLQEEMATYCSIFTWRICVDRRAWWAPVLGVAKNQDMTEHAHTHTYCNVNDSKNPLKNTRLKYRTNYN